VPGGVQRAFIAHVEGRFDDDETKNNLTRRVPNPSTDPDFVRVWLQTFRNEQVWNQDDELVEWLQSARLSGLRTRVGTPLPPAGPARSETLMQFAGLVDLLLDRYREYIPDQLNEVAAVAERA
jgi:phenylpropionate dioxygenase-like ring-hydroxylating dioxygenase large terminal subunit